MNLAWIRNFSSLFRETRLVWLPSYSHILSELTNCWVVTRCRWLFNGYFTAWVRISNESSHFLFSQQQIPCFAPLPDSTVKMVFALIKALCATVKITVKTTVMKKAVKTLKVGTGGLFYSVILYQLQLMQNRLSRKCDSVCLLCVG